MKFTIIGGKGFIGSELIKHLKTKEAVYWAPEKNDTRVFNDDLGTVVYCAGHGDCLGNPQKVIDSNLTHLKNIIEKSNFEKIIYLSSTRLYLNNNDANEDSNLKIDFKDNRKLFNLSKLAAEELCLKARKNSIVLRLSNVYGLALDSPLFLPAITRDAINKKHIDMYVSPMYSKDYVSVGDVVKSIYELSKIESATGIFNIASGHNVTAQQIAITLKEKTMTDITWHPISLNEDLFPEININKIKKHLDFSPRNVLKDLSAMIDDFTSTMARA